jgi:hypothetical protein
VGNPSDKQLNDIVFGFDEDALFAAHAAHDPFLEKMPGLRMLLEAAGIIEPRPNRDGET